MAVVVVANIEGGSQDLYETVTGKVMPDGQLPDGATIHIAGPIDGGWRVITVWDSQEQFDAFRDSSLIPALQEAGEGERVQPSITADPVHRVITA
jgi:hypothetical protein